MGLRSPSGHSYSCIGSEPMAQHNFIRANTTSSSHCVSWDFGVPLGTIRHVLGQSQWPNTTLSELTELLPHIVSRGITESLSALILSYWVRANTTSSEPTQLLPHTVSHRITGVPPSTQSHTRSRIGSDSIYNHHYHN